MFFRQSCFQQSVRQCFSSRTCLQFWKPQPQLLLKASLFSDDLGWFLSNVFLRFVLVSLISGKIRGSVIICDDVERFFKEASPAAL